MGKLILLKLFFLSVVFPLRGYTQQPVHIDPSMYTAINEILVADMDGWMFKNGADTNNNNGWIKLKPSELTGRMADDNGRLEGWFRFKAIFDSSFIVPPLNLRFYAWAAADIFINGELRARYGRIGKDKTDFIEFNPSNKMPFAATFQPGNINTIEIHFADYISFFNRNQLKSADTKLRDFLRIVGPVYTQRLKKHIREWPVYSTIWITMISIMVFLFWLLAAINRKEKNLRLFALAVTFFGLQFISRTFLDNEAISYTAFKLYSISFTVFALLSMIFTVLILSRVLTNGISKVARGIIGLYLVVGLINIFRQSDLISIILNMVPLLVYSYYVIISWKKIKGAQWAIVLGLMLNLVLSVYFIFNLVIYKSEFFPNVTLLVTIISMVLPVFLLIYVALRFKEIIREVELNSEQVLRLSEEKRMQSLKQQELLEAEVKKQTAELRTTLDNLKSTQTQLIHSEKMASLGELTAGIAHEIQNPLNFVNNFSELNTELIDEMKQQLKGGTVDVAMELADNIRDNEEKIKFHGKRADSIVKGMLQHSHASAGQKEATDLNQLIDEYMRLAFHGWKAKDRSFNAKFEMVADPNLPKITLVAQEIGRVLLNLTNNAFYAINERSKRESSMNYDPLLSVSTSFENDQVRISFRDNGYGIPEAIKEKIFQPFFTTKPTGEGTGLGLSLAYDIITKGHSGKLNVVSKEGTGTEFIIILPVN